MAETICVISEILDIKLQLCSSQFLFFEENLTYYEGGLSHGHVSLVPT